MELEKLASMCEAVRVMPLRPDDMLVFRTSVALDVDQMLMVHAYLEEQTGHSRILIIDRGADLEVYRGTELAVLRPDGEQQPAQALAMEQPKHRPIAGPAVDLPGAPREKQGKAPGAIA